MFPNTLNKTEKTVRTAVSKSSDGVCVTPDLLYQPKSLPYSEEVITAVKNHIKSFPVMESHYVRKGTKRQYLSSQLNVAMMHRLFVENTKREVGLQTYLDIFNTHFNRGFHKLKKGQMRHL